MRALAGIVGPGGGGAAQRWRPPCSTLRGPKVSLHRKAPCRPLQAGMYVPSDSFGGLSPEQKAANQLRALFTFIAARVIMAQLEGSGRGALGAYNATAYQTLSAHLQQGGASALSRDPDAWLEGLLEKDPALALRVIEVRSAYAEENFEWGQLKRLAVKDTKTANLALMRKAAAASLRAAAPAAVGGPGEAGEEGGTEGAAGSSGGDSGGGGGEAGGSGKDVA